MRTVLSPEVADDRRRSAGTWLLLGLAAFWALLWFVHAFGYWEDDAWIHLEFARSLARGQGFSFNGHIVYGDTSPLWVWLLAAVHLIIPNWLIAGKVLTLAAAFFALSGAFYLAQSFTAPLGAAASRRFAAASLLVFVVNPYFGYWAYSGMEALAASGLVCWALVSIAGSSQTRPLAPSRFLLACFCAGIAPLLRPEMVLFTLLLGLVLFVRWANLSVPPRRKLALFFAGFCLVLAPGVGWAVYAARTFGAILPNTNAAKRADPHDSVLRHLFGIYALGFPLVLTGLLALAAWLLLRLRQQSSHSREVLSEHTPPSLASVTPASLAASLDTASWLLLLWTGFNCLFYVLNHTYVQTRYIFVTAPVLTIAILAVARKLWPQGYRAAIGLGLFFGVTVSFLATWPLLRNKVGVDREYAQLASFLRTLPADAPVAHYSIGEAAFLSEHPIIDLGGITRPGIIPFLWDVTDNRRIWWTHEQGARYMVIDHAPEPGSSLVWRHTVPTTGWFLDPRRYGRKELLMVWKLPPSPTLPLSPELPPNEP